MFKAIMLTVALVCWAVAAQAIETKQLVPLNSVVGATSTVQYSSAINVIRFPNKTINVTGITAGGAFKNMSGVVVAECSPTGGAPWFGAGRWQDSVGTAVSQTGNGNITWRDHCSYLRLKWTPTTVSTRIKVWLNLSE